MPSFDPLIVANHILGVAATARQSLTPMKLQKLAFFTHGFSLSRYDSPAIDAPFEAWPYGPVNEDIYDAFNRFGSNNISEYATSVFGSPLPDLPSLGGASELVGLIDQVWGTFGPISAVTLSQMTHYADTPWTQVAKQFEERMKRPVSVRDHEAIPNSLITEYFRKFDVR